MEWLKTIMDNWFFWVYTLATNWHNLSEQVVSSALLPIFLLGAMLLIVGTVGLIFMGTAWGREKDEPEFREVAPGVRAWDVDRNSLWVRYYHFCFLKYPCDICSYIKHSAAMLTIGLLVVVGFLNFAFAVGVVIAYLAYWAVYFIALFLVGLPTTVPIYTWSVWSTILATPSLLTQIGRSVYEQGWDSYLIIFAGICSILYLLQLMRRSRSYQLVKLRIKSLQEKHCILVRVK